MKIVNQSIYLGLAFFACFCNVSCNSEKKENSEKIENQEQASLHSESAYVSEEEEMLKIIDDMQGYLPNIDFDKEFDRLTKEGYCDIKISGNLTGYCQDNTKNVIMLYPVNTEKANISGFYKYWTIVGKDFQATFNYGKTIDAINPKLIFEGNLIKDSKDIFGIAFKNDSNIFKYQLYELDEDVESNIYSAYAIGDAITVDEEVLKKNNLTLDDIYTIDGDNIVVRNTANGKLEKKEISKDYFHSY